MYDVNKLTTPDQCEIVMVRARNQGLENIYRDVLRRYCELVGKEMDKPDDPIVRELWEGIAAYEAHLFEKHGGKKIKASRTRQKLKNKGVHQSLIEWTKASKETEGFAALVELGMPELTGEYIVAKYADRFPAEVVKTAMDRLDQHNIDRPLRPEQ